MSELSYSAQAKLLVGQDRNKDYGNPANDFAATGKIWSGLLSAKLTSDITASEVALMMAALKLRREANKHKPDNIIDAHGYLDCAEWILKGEFPA